MKGKWRYLFLSGLVATAVYLYRKFSRARVQAVRRWRSGSQTMPVAGGEIEYAIVGEGPPLLFVHGGFGGYEQGIALAPLLFPKHQVIAVSRPGHRRRHRRHSGESRPPGLGLVTRFSESPRESKRRLAPSTPSQPREGRRAPTAVARPAS